MHAGICLNRSRCSTMTPRILSNWSEKWLTKGALRSKLAEDCPDIKMHVGGAANPNANPLEPEILHIQRKANAGVEFLQTQVVYDINIAETFLKEVKSKTECPCCSVYFQ